MPETILVRIKTWTDTKANWETKNPVLFLGERGYESDTLFSKTGDGTSLWNDLDYDKATAPTNWTSTQKYDTDSVVGYNGKVYVSLQTDNLGKDPETETEWWGTAEIVIDSELSLVSENPVQNKVVTGALNGKQATLTAGGNIDITDNVISADIPPPFIESVDSTITVNESGQASVTNPLPSGGKDGQPLVKSGLDTPLYRQGCFRYSASGVFWDIIDVASMTRETPSSYVASSGNDLVASAFNDDLNNRWIAAAGVTDAYIDITFSSAVSISVLGLFFGSNGKPKFIEVSDANTGQMLAYFKTIRNAEHRYDTTTQGNIDYYTICSLKSTDKIRIRFYEDWFTTNFVSCSVIQLFSGDIAYKPNAFFGNNGFFSLLSQTETTTAQLAEMFRPLSNAGWTRQASGSGTKSMVVSELDTSYLFVSGGTWTLPSATDVGALGKNVFFHNSGSTAVTIRVITGDRGIINGERIISLSFSIPQYGSLWCKCVRNAEATGWEFEPTTPEMLDATANRKSINARKLDDYYELDATVALVSGGGTLTIGATNKVISSVKVGQNVNISGYLDVSVATSPTGTLTITGLPHTCRSGLKYDSELSISVEGVTIPAGYYWSVYVINNTTTIRIRLLDLTGTVVDASPYMTTDAKIRLGGVYNANS